MHVLTSRLKFIGFLIFMATSFQSNASLRDLDEGITKSPPVNLNLTEGSAEAEIINALKVATPKEIWNSFQQNHPLSLKSKLQDLRKGLDESYSLYVRMESEIEEIRQNGLMSPCLNVLVGGTVIGSILGDPTPENLKSSLLFLPMLWMSAAAIYTHFTHDQKPLKDQGYKLEPIQKTYKDLSPVEHLILSRKASDLWDLINIFENS